MHRITIIAALLTLAACDQAEPTALETDLADEAGLGCVDSLPVCAADGRCWTTATGWASWALAPTEQLQDLMSNAGEPTAVYGPHECYEIGEGTICFIEVDCAWVVARPIREMERAAVTCDVHAGDTWGEVFFADGDCYGTHGVFAVPITSEP